MSGTLAAILGGAAGAVALVVIVTLIIWYCLSHKRSISRTSETGSSEPSVQGRHVGVELSRHEARRFAMEELSLATKSFSDQNLIGIGSFGEVYKGLLNDGMLVAVKRRPGIPTREFVDEALYLAPIQHRNLVTLLGYCQESSLQFLVYEYIPNGSVSSHLYGSQASREKLEFKNRLSIALGAAKGLAHLHSLSPRLVHKGFKTSNVLVDENFISKVADAGLSNFLGIVKFVGSSSETTSNDIFHSPELKEFKRFSEKSDIYSFGVFLLELLSGKEATEPPFPHYRQNLVEWVQSNGDFSNLSSIIDERIGSFTTEGMEGLLHLILQCVEISSERRPGMSLVVMELDRILEKEMNLTTVMGEGTATVTLGSQLFRAK